MTILRSLFGERRAIDASQFPYAYAQDGQNTHSGIVVDQDTALTNGAVFSCVRLISETTAALPWDVVRTKGPDRISVSNAPAWVTQPNPEMTLIEFRQRVRTCLEVDGNAYVFIGALDRLGYPAELWLLHPSDVEVKRDSMGKLLFDWKGTETLRPWNPANPQVGSVLHIKGFSNGGDKGLSPIDLAREAIGLGLTTEQFGARFFGNGQNPSGVIEVAQGVQAGEDFKKAIKQSWMGAHGGVKKSHLPAVLVGATWKPVTLPNDNAQFLETRKFQVSEIARWFGVPPHLIGDVEKTTSWGTGIEQQGIGFVTYSLAPRLVREEQSFSTLLPRGQYLKIKTNALMRGDSKARAEFYASGIQNGWLVRNEARALEDLNALDGLDEPLVPNANAVPAETEPVKEENAAPVYEIHNHVDARTEVAPAAVNVTVPERKVDVHNENQVDARTSVDVPTPVVNNTIETPAPKPVTETITVDERDEQGRAKRFTKETKETGTAR